MAMNQQLENRPNPEDLLKKINKQNRTRGDLTVFLGAMAGVGKTFTMLEAAHVKIKEGKDIMIGWVETHGRADTKSVAAGIPQVPPREVPYRGKILLEMDIDAILARRPEIVIVDELAHTNVDGSRHVRRFQDVEELLEAGIHVYTAVNIQHIESLNDIVAQITGVIVRETVPDSVLENADMVQLIDIAPEELMKRLHAGKIYMPEQAEQALKKFFRQGNISALRELSLRFTAQHVDKDLEAYMRQHNIQGPWQASGRVMVGVSGSPFSAQLIRAAARLAMGLRSELLAVHVEATHTRFPLGDKERDRIAKNMRMAEELGAKTLTVVADHFVGEFLEIARKQNITAIVIGKPKHSKFTELIGGSAVDNIIRRSGDINVYVIQTREENEASSAVKTLRIQPVGDPTAYFLSLLMVAAITVVTILFKDYLESMDAALLYIIPVLFSAVWWGRWPSFAAAVAGIMSFDFFFVEPLLTLTVNDFRYLWSFMIFLLISFLIGGRTQKLRSETRQARQQEKSTRAVYEFSRDIAAVSDAEVIAKGLVKQAGETLERKIIIVLPDAQGHLKRGVKFDLTVETMEQQIFMTDISETEAAVVAWVYKNRQPAGRTTDTLPGGKYLYIPLCGQGDVFGVFGICLAEKKLTPSERRLVDAWTRMAAIAIERASLTEQARHADLLIEADKLRGALFNSISHELKTPLAAILGSVSTLLEADEIYSKADRQELLGNIKESSLRMDRLIANLLDTARLESGMMRLKSDWCDVEDIIGTVLRRMDDLVKEQKIHVELADNLPLIRADCVLLEQVLINLLDNAIKYSSVADITVKVQMNNGFVGIAVMDRGVGIPAADLGKVFDKFYRVKQPGKVSGTGLGLSICKGIIEAHQGEIYAENRSGGGTTIHFLLPVELYEKTVK